MNYKWEILFTWCLLLLQLACNENITGINRTPNKEWYSQLSIDATHTILRSDGTVWSWGLNTYGTLGDGTSENSNIPVKAKNLNNVIAIDQSYGAEVAADQEGDVWFWGNLFIYYGPPDIDTNTTVPTKISHLNGIKSISIQSIFIFLLKTDGTVWTLILDWYTPTIVDGPKKINEISEVVAIEKDIALTSDGKIFDLLSKRFLQDSLQNIISVSGRDERHLIVLKSDGTVWGWGDNDLGQLGNGTFEDSDFPIRVCNLTDIVSITANYDYNLALKKDGTVWFWGFAPNNDTLTGLNIPVKILDLDNVVLICAGSNSLVMKFDGSYWTFSVTERIPRQIIF